MAKADYPCPECGTSITIVGNNRKDADRRAAKATRVCDRCSRKAFDEANAAAAAAAVEAGLTELKGTPKQIAWAETIRAGRIALLDASDAISEVVYAALTAEQSDGDESLVERGAAAMRAQPYGAPLNYSGGSDVLESLPTLEHWREFARLLRDRADAHAWIDDRSSGWAAMARAEKRRVEEAMKAAMPGAAEQAALEAEVKAEAVLKPARDLAGKRIAEVTYAAPHLRVHYDIKNEALRELVKGRGFHWEATRWERKLDDRHGDPVHRMAETAHLLLADGLQVRVMNTTAHEMAVSGEFTPEQTRWLRVRRDGERAGWTVASWLPFEDLYEEAKKVPGSRYEAFAGVLFPPSAIVEAIDFAERFDFAVSDRARAALATHEATLAAGIVVDAKKPRKRATPKGRPVLTAVMEGVDADLLDHY